MQVLPGGLAQIGALVDPECLRLCKPRIHQLARVNSVGDEDLVPLPRRRFGLVAR